MRAAVHMPVPHWGRSWPDRGLDGQYKFIELPVTEAAATSTAFVCEFTGGAGANETGVGGGLTGADLVFTAVNSPGASSGGWRPIVKDTNQGLCPTTGFVTTITQAPAGCSFLWVLKDLDVSVQSGVRNYLFELQSSSFATGGVSILGNMSSANRRSMQISAQAYAAADSVGATLGNADAGSSNSATSEFMVMASLDYATKTAFVGVKLGTLQPKKLTDFLYFSLNRGDSVFAGAVATTAFNYSRDTVIGSRDSNYSNDTAGIKIASFTAAKYPCFIPA